MTWVAILVWTAFIGWYTVRARWWTRLFGWNTTLTSLAIVLLVCHPQNPVVLAFTALAGVWRIWLLEYAQRRNKR